MMCNPQFVPNIRVISIEGNIGSGKSTFLAKLMHHYEGHPYYVFVKEPVEEWSHITDEKGVTILEKFYADQKKYSFPFQMMAYISRLRNLKSIIDDLKQRQYEAYLAETQRRRILYDLQEDDTVIQLPTYYIITERSLYTDKFVFAKMLYDSGKIEHINYQIYLNWFDTFAKDYPVHKNIYINTNSMVCHERIRQRHREGENRIQLEYLIACDRYHRDMVQANVCGGEWLTLNGNIDIVKHPDTVDEWLNMFHAFVVA